MPPTGPAVRTLEVSRKLVHYVFSTEGAGLVSAKLQGEKTREQLPLSITEGWAQLLGKHVPEGPQMDLAQPVPGAPLPLSVELAGDSAIPATLRYSAEEGDHRITFVGRTESWEVTKEVSWVDDGYELSDPRDVEEPDPAGHSRASWCSPTDARSIRRTRRSRASSAAWATSPTPPAS